MKSPLDHQSLLLLLQRALLGEVHPDLRQASAEVDETNGAVLVRFEYDGLPSEASRESCSCAATEVIAAFPAPWQLDEQHVFLPYPEPLASLRHVAYLRAESRPAT